jgi:hypothetical protein
MASRVSCKLPEGQGKQLASKCSVSIPDQRDYRKNTLLVQGLSAVATREELGGKPA